LGGVCIMSLPLTVYFMMFARESIELLSGMAYEPAIPEDWEGILPDQEIRSIEFRNVGFAYQNGRMTLKNISFTLKSGRKSPFFMNAGAYVTGSQLRRLGQYYAKAIHDHYGEDFDVLFGPAYKGIPLSVATTIAFSELYGKDIRYCSNRKEAKDHGDAGILLGSPIKDGDRVVIIEDVTTSGKSIEETFPIIKAQGDVEIVGLMVSLNRMERGKGEKSALEEVQELYGFKANAIVTMADVVEHLYNRECLGQIVIDDTLKAAIDAYYEQYGVKKA